MSPKDLRKIQKTDKIKVKSSNTKLRMYNDQIVPVQGEVTLTCIRLGFEDLGVQIKKTGSADLCTKYSSGG